MLAKRYKEDGVIDICTCKQLQPQFILTARIHCSSPPPPYFVRAQFYTE